MIDPSIWSSEDFSKLTPLSRLIWIGLFSNADDEGIGRGNAVYIKSVVFPYDENIKVADITKALAEISANMSIIFYSDKGNEYYQLTGWDKWQTINRPTPSRLPKPSEIHINEYSLNNHGRLTPNIKEKNIDKDNINMLGAEAPNKAIIELTLNDKSLYPIYQENIDEWVSLYPSVDVMQELRNMKGWLLANDKKRKTKNGIMRFINSWLSNKQDSPKATESKKELKRLE